MTEITVVADDEESMAGDLTPSEYVDIEYGTDKYSRADGAFAHEMQFVGYAREKWNVKNPRLGPGSSLPPISLDISENFRENSADALPSLHDMGVLQFLAEEKEKEKGQASSVRYPRQVKFIHHHGPDGTVKKRCTGQLAKYHDVRLPFPIEHKLIHYRYKPVHYAPNDTMFDTTAQNIGINPAHYIDGPDVNRMYYPL